MDEALAQYIGTPPQARNHAIPAVFQDKKNWFDKVMSLAPMVLSLIAMFLAAISISAAVSGKPQPLQKVQSEPQVQSAPMTFSPVRIHGLRLGFALPDHSGVFVRERTNERFSQNLPAIRRSTPRNGLQADTPVLASSWHRPCACRTEGQSHFGCYVQYHPERQAKWQDRT